MAGQQVGSISIKVTPDTKMFRKQLQAELDAIEKSLEAKIPVKLDLDANGIRQKVKAELAGLNQTVKVKLDVDRSKLPKIPGGKGGVVGGGGVNPFGSMGSGLALIAAVAALAAPALALISGVLVSLPAAISAVLIPIAAIALGMDGLKKAAQVLTQPLADLKAVMSQKFQDVFTPIFTNLRSVFPALEASLPAVADGLGKMAKAFVDTVTSGPGLESIKGTIGNIAKTLSDAAPGVGTLTNGLLNLANGVTAKFPAVSEWFNKVGKSFDDWVTKMSTVDASGTSPLDRAMGNLGDTLKGVLDIVGELAKQGFDWLQDPKFGESMKNFVADLKDVVTNVLPHLGQFFQDLGPVIHDLATVLSLIPKETAPKAPKPDNPTAVGIFPGFTNGKTPWAETASSFQQTMTLVEGMFTVLWGKIKTGFATAWQDTVTSFQSSMSIVGGIATVAWETIKSGAATAASAIGSTLGSIGATLQGAWASIPGIAAGVWNTVVSTVAGVMAQLIAAVVNVGGQIVAEVASWGGKVATAAVSIANALVGIGPQMIAGFLGGFRSAAAAAVTEVAGWAAKIAAAAKSALGIHSPSKVFTDIGAQTAQGLQNGLEGGFQGVIARAGELSKQLADAVNNGLTGINATSINDQIKQQLAELELERKQLKVDKNAIPKDKEHKGQRDAIQGQMDQIQALKDQLNLQKDQLGFSDKYGQSTEDNNKLLSDSADRFIGIGKNFAMANINQFQSDLGISGNGAIPTLGNMGVDFLSSMLSNLFKGGLQTNIHVNSLDEAMAAKQNMTNKQALQYAQR